MTVGMEATSVTVNERRVYPISLFAPTDDAYDTITGVTVTTTAGTEATKSTVLFVETGRSFVLMKDVV